MSLSRGALFQVLIALALLGRATVVRADSLRCGQRIVATGDSTYAVRSLCGEPAERRQRAETVMELRKVSVACASSKTPHRRCERVERVAREVQIDEWTYDFGPQRFVQILTFVDGTLETVAAGGRGGGKR